MTIRLMRDGVEIGRAENPMPEDFEQWEAQGITTEKVNSERKKRGPYNTKKRQAEQAAKAAMPTPMASEMAFNFIGQSHAALQASYREQRVFGIQRKPTKAERILEVHIRSMMAGLAPFCTDGGDDE